MRRALFCTLLSVSAFCQAQSVFDSITKPVGLSAYIFVSSSLSETTLINLARDASKTGMTLVLNADFTTGAGAREETRRRVAMIDEACCGRRSVSWMINPILFDRYKIRAVPTFVIAQGESADPSDYSKVSGEMSVANALKFFYQGSQIPAIKKKSGEIYQKLTLVN